MATGGVQHGTPEVETKQRERGVSPVQKDHRHVGRDCAHTERHRYILPPSGVPAPPPCLHTKQYHEDRPECERTQLHAEALP